MMHVLTFILQHVNILTIYCLMMTPYDSQMRVMLTFYITQLYEALGLGECIPMIAGVSISFVK